MDKATQENGDTIITDRFVVNRPADELTREEVAKLTPQIVIERCKALKPFFLAHAAETEKLGRPSDEVWRAVLKTGYMYMAVTKHYGGLQASMEEILEATAPMSEADPSLGWVACFCAMSPRGVAGYPMSVQDKMMKNGECPVLTNLVSPTGHAKKVKGGYVLNGRWAWCTTIQFAEWVNIFCRIENEDGSQGPHVVFLAKAKDVQIIKTWDAHGMIGTGTHHVAAHDLFVPDDMVASANNSEPAWYEQIEKNHPGYKLFLSAAAPAASLCVVGPVVQAARGAVEAARDHLLHYTKRSSPDEEKLKMTVQLRLGEASALCKAAELLYREVTRVTFSELGWRDAEDKALYHEVRSWLGEAADLSRKVVHILAQAAGTSIHYYSHRLGRHYRDVITGSSHVTCDFDVLVLGHGQKMLGVEPRRRQHQANRNKIRNEIAATKGGDYARVSDDIEILPTV